MRGDRLLHTLKMCLILSSKKRTEYLRKKQIFKEIGDNCNFMNRTVPLYPKLIKIGNNVRIASGVSFITHDVTHSMLNEMPDNNHEFIEKIGCIEIGNNVFIGAGTTILYNVHIGSNVIIGAGSLVNKDVPSNSVAVGVPARVISSMEDYMKKRIDEVGYPSELSPHNEDISDELVEWCWRDFWEKRHNSR